MADGGQGLRQHQDSYRHGLDRSTGVDVIVPMASLRSAGVAAAAANYLAQAGLPQAQDHLLAAAQLQLLEQARRMQAAGPRPIFAGRHFGAPSGSATDQPAAARGVAVVAERRPSNGQPGAGPAVNVPAIPPYGAQFHPSGPPAKRQRGEHSWPLASAAAGQQTAQRGPDALEAGGRDSTSPLQPAPSIRAEHLPQPLHRHSVGQAPLRPPAQGLRQEHPPWMDDKRGAQQQALEHLLVGAQARLPQGRILQSQPSPQSAQQTAQVLQGQPQRPRQHSFDYLYRCALRRMDPDTAQVQGPKNEAQDMGRAGAVGVDGLPGLRPNSADSAAAAEHAGGHAVKAVSAAGAYPPSRAPAASGSGAAGATGRAAAGSSAVGAGLDAKAPAAAAECAAAGGGASRADAACAPVHTALQRKAASAGGGERLEPRARTSGPPAFGAGDSDPSPPPARCDPHRQEDPRAAPMPSPAQRRPSQHQASVQPPVQQQPPVEPPAQTQQESRPRPSEAVLTDADALLEAVAPMLRRAPAYAMISIAALLGVAAANAARRRCRLKPWLLSQARALAAAQMQLADAVAQAHGGTAAQRGAMAAAASYDNKLLVLLDMGGGAGGAGQQGSPQHRQAQPDATRWFVLHWWPEDEGDSGRLELGARGGGRLEPLRAFASRFSPHAEPGAEAGGVEEAEAAVLQLIGVLPPPSVQGMGGLAELQEALAGGRLRETQLLTLAQWCAAADAGVGVAALGAGRFWADPRSSVDFVSRARRPAEAALLMLAEAAEETEEAELPCYAPPRNTVRQVHAAPVAPLPHAAVRPHVAPATLQSGMRPPPRSLIQGPSPGFAAGASHGPQPGWRPAGGAGGAPHEQLEVLPVPELRPVRAFGKHPTGGSAPLCQLMPRASEAQLERLADCIREKEPGQEYEPLYVRLGGLVPLRPGAGTLGSQGPSGPDTLVGVMVCPAGAAHASGQVGRPRRGLAVLLVGDEEPNPDAERAKGRKRAGRRGRRGGDGSPGDGGSGQSDSGSESGSGSDTASDEEEEEEDDGVVREEDPRDAADRYLQPTGPKSRSWHETFEVAMVERDGARVWVPYKRWRQLDMAGATELSVLRVELPAA